MDKYAVEIDETEKTKTASSSKPTCPSCGGALSMNSNVPSCSTCGTKPFEKKPK